MDSNRYYVLLGPAADLIVKKHKDYQRGAIQLHSYFPFGYRSYVQMIHVKSQRLVALAQEDIAPTNESIKDTLYDLINYAVFMLDHIDNVEKEDGL